MLGGHSRSMTRTTPAWSTRWRWTTWWRCGVSSDSEHRALTHTVLFYIICRYSLFLQSLYKMLEGMGNRPSGDPKVRAKDIFSTIDVNQDGTLTKDEFIKGLCLIIQNEHWNFIRFPNTRLPNGRWADGVVRKIIWNPFRVPRESTRGVDQIKNEVFEEIVEVGTIDNA